MNNLVYLQTAKIGSSESMIQTQMDMTYRAPVEHTYTTITEQGNKNNNHKFLFFIFLPKQKTISSINTNFGMKCLTLA